tara:strand:- start:16 stop:153 length:138 start_codon:yes stop_codon:yes gene_type:complete
MVLVQKYGQTTVNMKVSMKMVLKMEMVSFIGQMKVYMREIGKIMS